jgi:hypothetical protein
MGLLGKEDVVPVTLDGVVIDPVTAGRAMRAVALRTEMSVDERYGALEMLGLVKTTEPDVTRGD